MTSLGAILKRTSKHISTHLKSTQEVVQKETSWYLDSPDLDQDKDPLNWWKHEAQHLPILARLVRKYLCACGMSTPLE